MIHVFSSLPSQDVHGQSQQPQSAHHHDHWQPRVDYHLHIVADIFIPMILWFDWLMFVLGNMEGNMMRLNGEFDLQLTIEDVCEMYKSFDFSELDKTSYFYGQLVM